LKLPKVYYRALLKIIFENNGLMFTFTRFGFFLLRNDFRNVRKPKNMKKHF
jgi:hypothetical protein